MTMKKDKFLSLLSPIILIALVGFILFMTANIFNADPYDISKIFINRNKRLFLLYLISYCVLFIAYIPIIVFDIEINLKTLLIVVSLLYLPFLFIRPLSSSDIFTYIYRGRIHSQFKENSYLISYSEFKHDVLYESLNNDFEKNTSIYGPIFIAFSTIITKIAGNSFLGNILLFKGLACITTLFCVFLLYKLSNNAKITLIFALNPIIIMEIVLHAHLDIYMIFFLLLGFYTFFNYTGKYSDYLIIFFIILSGLIKFFTFALLPFFIVFLAKKEGNGLDFKKFIFLAAFSLGLILLFYFPYWEGFQIFNRNFVLLTDKLYFRPAPVIWLSYNLFGGYLIDNLTKIIWILRIFALIFYVFLLIKSYKVQNQDFFLIYILISSILTINIFFTLWFIWYEVTNILIISVLLVKFSNTKVSISLYTLTLLAFLLDTLYFLL